MSMEITFTLTHATLSKSDYEKIVGFCRTHGLTDLPSFPVLADPLDPFDDKGRFLPSETSPEIIIPNKKGEFKPKDFTPK